MQHNDFGGVLKTLTLWICALSEAILIVFCLLTLGLYIFIFGSIFIIISGFFMYGFGELIENTYISAIKNAITNDNIKVIRKEIEEIKRELKQVNANTGESPSVNPNTEDNESSKHTTKSEKLYEEYKKKYKHI